MNTKKHVTEIAGFAEAYEEVYESVRLPQKGNQFDNLFVLMRAHVVVDAFEEKYDVALLSIDDTSAVGDMVYRFDTVDFKTEENMTMCLLKWS